jgi:hypothetical protein
MTPQQHYEGMKWARDMGRSANQLVWWHIHPVVGWSGTDENTMRQRVHQAGLQEVLCTLSFVLTPRGLLVRWDQSGPDPKDNIFVDNIPIQVGTPDLVEVQRQAAQEVRELLSQRADQQVAEEEERKEPPSVPGMVARASWQRPVLHQPDPLEFPELDMDPTMADLWRMAGDQAIVEVVEEIEGSGGFACRQDPETLVDSWSCSQCPFVTRCFKVTYAELDERAAALIAGL